jgi:type IV secretory pathway TrbF-like protein
LIVATLLKNTPAYEDALVAQHNQRLWRLLIGSAAINALLIAALCIVTLRPHGTPYIVEVNKQGEPLGTILPFADRQPVTDNLIRFTLGEYMRNAFGVAASWQANKDDLGQAYAMSTGQASKALTAYYRGNHDANNPLMADGKYWQYVQIVRTLKLPAASTYEVDYIVQRHDHDHPVNPQSTNWRATMSVVQGKPTDNNPLGLWVNSLDFEPDEVK